MVLGQDTTPRLYPVAGATGAGRAPSVQVVPPLVVYPAEEPTISQMVALAQARDSG